MRLSTLAALLFALGLFAAGVASVGLLVGFEPARLPPAMLNAATYELAYTAALLLIGLGAVLRRHARRAATAPPDAIPPDVAPPPLAAGSPPDAPYAGARRATPPPVEREPRP